jgi:hypothetical protein
MCFALITNKVNILKLVLILYLIPVSSLKLKRSLILKGLNKNRKRFANPNPSNPAAHPWPFSLFLPVRPTFPSLSFGPTHLLARTFSSGDRVSFFLVVF